MPLSKYDRWFGGDAAKAMRELVKRYGPEKGRRIFYATVKKKQKG